jgi:hypothetical protein
MIVSISDSSLQLGLLILHKSIEHEGVKQAFFFLYA